MSNHLCAAEVTQSIDRLPKKKHGAVRVYVHNFCSFSYTLFSLMTMTTTAAAAAARFFLDKNHLFPHLYK